jgi:hypothetical protein
MSDLKSPVIGQTIPHIDRDSQVENEKREYTFPEQRVAPATVNSVPFQSRPNSELDELFENFRTVLLGKDVSTTQKGMVLWTVLENYKHGTPEVSRSQSCSSHRYPFDHGCPFD